MAEHPGFQVIAEARDVPGLLGLADRALPDVLLLSRCVPDDDVCALAAAYPTACILCLDESADSKVTSLPLDADVEHLCSVLDATLGGRCAGCAFRSQCPARVIAAALTPRERQVAVCVAQGMSSKRIAGTLGIGLRTVNTYRERLAKKIGASSGAVVTRYVLEHQLLAQQTESR